MCLKQNQNSYKNKLEVRDNSRHLRLDLCLIRKLRWTLLILLYALSRKTLCSNMVQNMHLQVQSNFKRTILTILWGRFICLLLAFFSYCNIHKWLTKKIEFQNTRHYKIASPRKYVSGKILGLINDWFAVTIVSTSRKDCKGSKGSYLSITLSYGLLCQN